MCYLWIFIIIIFPKFANYLAVKLCIKDTNVTFSNTSSTFIPHNTAYLDISSVTDKKDSYEMYTSGISEVKIDPSTDSRIYDLHVENPTRGIYIRNGKKFVVK